MLVQCCNNFQVCIEWEVIQVYFHFSPLLLWDQHSEGNFSKNSCLPPLCPKPNLLKFPRKCHNPPQGTLSHISHLCLCSQECLGCINWRALSKTNPSMWKAALMPGGINTQVSPLSGFTFVIMIMRGSDEITSQDLFLGEQLPTQHQRKWAKGPHFIRIQSWGRPHAVGGTNIRSKILHASLLLFPSSTAHSQDARKFSP